MNPSIFNEISAKTLEIYISRNDYGVDYMYKKIFPSKYVTSLLYQTLIGAQGNPVIADVVSYDASAPEKSRKTISILTGAIPAIKILRRMTEVQINQYLNQKNDPRIDKDALLKVLFNDIDYCFTGLEGQKEWMCHQLLSQGFIAYDSTNNAGVVTENNIDFQLPAANKRKVKSATGTRVWNNGTAANYLPITDIEVIVAAARALGIKLKYLLMNYTKWAQFRAATEVIEYVGGLTTAIRTPTLNEVNVVMAAQGLPKIVLMDALLNIETAEHVITATNPWVTKYVTFIPETILGNMLEAPIAAEQLNLPQTKKVRKGNALVLKYSTLNPVNEITEGQINAFPSFPSIDRCIRFDTEATPEADGLDD